MEQDMGTIVDNLIFYLLIVKLLRYRVFFSISAETGGNYVFKRKY